MSTRHALSNAACISLALLLAACGGRYQAPLDDQSQVLEREAPAIYSTSGGASAPVSAPARSTGSSSGARTIAAGVSVQPAPGVSVNVANEPGSIRRGAISRTPIDGSGSPVSSGIAPEQPISAASAPTPSLAGQTHTVAQGDTLYSIAYRYSLDYRALALANNLSAPYTIYPNQVLNLNIGGVNNNALDSVPAIPAAPAGDASLRVGERPAQSVAQRRTGNTPSRVIDGIAWQWPLDGRVLRGFSASASTTSRGIDIGGRRGDPVYAAADGDVVYAGRGIQGQGDLIIIRHSARHLSAYSYNSNMLVTEGARIRAGDKISEVGVDTRGSELIHFEVRVDGKPADPAQYLPPR
ncbi:MAG: peptidoglycan DD-metalloendopeptidase family protein [Pseudomonadales bacterium]|nr:peptidoglycan DD-metalloendopeptidase family protein [Pseudomonadales bacterium]MCP5358063.1 peptidoglycan DD-metalloendopeptidase family protein [Pseudomonadales bacterium]